MRAPELVPGWSFEVNEVETGLFVATAEDAFGRRMQATGDNPQSALEECRLGAASLPTPPPAPGGGAA